MKLLASSHFKRKYQKLIKRDPYLPQIIQKQVNLLIESKKHPGLELHKLKGDLSTEWSITIKKNLRLKFRYIKDGILIIDIGPHDEVY